MEYANAKGVGMQSSQMGKDRMDAALGLCALATGYMDCYTSERRVNEIAEFEKRTMGKQISNKKGFDYRADMDEVIKAAVNPINAMDDKETVQSKQNAAPAGVENETPQAEEEMGMK